MEHRKTRRFAIALTAVAALSAATLLQARQDMSQSDPTTQPTTPATTPANGELVTLEGGTKYKVVQQAGERRSAREGDVLFVHYTGRLTDGTVFDSSLSRPGRFGIPEPLTLQLGAGGVIPGMEAGLKGMQVGEKRTLIIPPEQAYGQREVGPIPAGSTLEFDVELVGLYRPTEQ